jgi:hypothetical protein
MKSAAVLATLAFEEASATEKRNTMLPPIHGVGVKVREAGEIKSRGEEVHG